MDDFLWKQLKRDTKSHDYSLQRMQLPLCHALVPTLKALQIIKEAPSDVSAVKPLLGDIFKILTHAVVKCNEARANRIKNELQPQFRSLVDNTPSSTKLFGDKLPDDIRNLKEARSTVTMVTSPTPFLSKRGGAVTKSKPSHGHHTLPQYNKQPRQNQRRFNKPKPRKYRM